MAEKAAGCLDDKARRFSVSIGLDIAFWPKVDIEHGRSISAKYGASYFELWSLPKGAFTDICLYLSLLLALLVPGMLI